jgi:hypothetical protein
MLIIKIKRATGKTIVFELGTTGGNIIKYKLIHCPERAETAEIPNKILFLFCVFERSRIKGIPKLKIRLA